MRRWRPRTRSPWRSLADGLVFLALLALAVAGANKAGWLAPETGRFTAIDGDSLRKGEQEYRLHGIDAPELHQTCTGLQGAEFSCGREARAYLRSLVEGKPLDCRIEDTDRYGRLVAECRAGSVNINREMVQGGWAIAYRRHGTAYADAESAARQAKRGIWQGRFEEPERWRTRNRHGLMQGGTAALPEPAED